MIRNPERKAGGLDEATTGKPQKETIGPSESTLETDWEV